MGFRVLGFRDVRILGFRVGGFRVWAGFGRVLGAGVKVRDWVGGSRVQVPLTLITNVTKSE